MSIVSNSSRQFKVGGIYIDGKTTKDYSDFIKFNYQSYYNHIMSDYEHSELKFKPFYAYNSCNTVNIPEPVYFIPTNPDIVLNFNHCIDIISLLNISQIKSLVGKNDTIKKLNTLLLNIAHSPFIMEDESFYFKSTYDGKPILGDGYWPFLDQIDFNVLLKENKIEKRKL